MALQFLLDSQKKFQEKVGYDFEKMTLPGKANYIKEMMFWTNDELSEAVHELPFAKSWSSKYEKPEYDKEKQITLVKEEMIDALHFFMNIFVALEMTEEEILKMYSEKNKINYDRQENGY